MPLDGPEGAQLTGKLVEGVVPRGGRLGFSHRPEQRPLSHFKAHKGLEVVTIPDNTLNVTGGGDGDRDLTETTSGLEWPREASGFPFNVRCKDHNDFS